MESSALEHLPKWTQRCLPVCCAIPLTYPLLQRLPALKPTPPTPPVEMLPSTTVPWSSRLLGSKTCQRSHLLTAVLPSSPSLPFPGLLWKTGKLVFDFVNIDRCYPPPPPSSLLIAPRPVPGIEPISLHFFHTILRETLFVGHIDGTLLMAADHKKDRSELSS
jgi:hypothetical protein